MTVRIVVHTHGTLVAAVLVASAGMFLGLLGSVVLWLLER